MDASRSVYYYKSKKVKDRDKELLDKIKAIATDFPCYGYRRITAELRRRGIAANKKRVQRIMAQNGIQCTIRRRYRVTTNSKAWPGKIPQPDKGFYHYKTGSAVALRYYLYKAGYLFCISCCHNRWVLPQGCGLCPGTYTFLQAYSRSPN
jgi:transposase InsO family protein